MAARPLQYVAPTGDADDLRFAPEPVAIYGLPEGGGDVEVTIADVTGLQAIITDLTDRIVALETAVGEA